MGPAERVALAEAAAEAAAAGRFDEAHRGFAEALTGEVRDVRVLFLAFQFHFRAGRTDEAERLTLLRLAVLAAERPSGELARAHANLSLIQLRQGRLEDAERAADAGVAVARKIGDAYEESRALHNLAMVHEKRGDLALAEAVYRAALAIAERIGANDLVATKQANLGDIAAVQGRTAEARAAWRRALELFEGLGQARFARELDEKLRALDAG